MMDKRLRSEIAHRELIISTAELLHFDSSITRFIMSGSKWRIVALGVLISY